MARTTPIAARVPHTAKRPERCPHCGSTAITRKGTRRKKIEIVQLWRCSSCIRVIVARPHSYLIFYAIDGDVLVVRNVRHLARRRPPSESS